MELITQLMAQMEVMQNLSDDQNQTLRINSFTVSPDEILGGQDQVTFTWNTTGTNGCSILYAGKYKGVLQTEVGTVGTYRTDTLGFKESDEYLQFELRCQSAYTQKDHTVSEYTKVYQSTSNTDAQTELQRVTDVLNSIGKKDSQDIKDALDDVESELIEYEARYANLLREAREYDLDDTIEDLIEKVDSYLNEAHEQYNDQDYDLADDNIEEAEDLLDELNDVLDDIEDGRVDRDDLQNVIDDLLDQVNIIDRQDDNDDRKRLSRAIAVGAYQGTLADGTYRGFREHPQGEVDVYLATDDYTRNVLLVLTSYEPVKWNIIGPGAKTIVTEVLLSGYHDQEVTGVASDVTVKMKSHQSGDRDYMYAYDRNSQNYTELREYIKQAHNVNITQFYGSYEQDEVRIESYKG